MADCGYGCVCGFGSSLASWVEWQLILWDSNLIVALNTYENKLVHIYYIDSPYRIDEVQIHPNNEKNEHKAKYLVY